MALRRFTRHPKNPPDDEVTPDAGGGPDQFSSNGAGPEGGSSNSVGKSPTVVAQPNPGGVVDPTDAGWYVDASDPQTKRYWDGHHWTGQTIRVEASP